MSVIANNLATVHDRITRYCDRAGRDPSDVSLMAVGKRQPVERVKEAIAAGHRLFGESIVQETRERVGVFPPESRVHLIGHLQRNKAKDAARLYNAIESIDAMRTLDALDSHARERDTPLDLFVEVNSSGELSKHGVAGYDEVLPLVERILSSAHYCFRGLMTVGPLSDSEREVREAFSSVRTYGERLVGAYPEISSIELSMGMSDDLEYAILEGSTVVRVGTAIFGARTR